MEWFADTDHVRRFQDWLATPGGWQLLHQADPVADRDARPVIVAEEAVLRGAGWLDQRWKEGGEKLKHMALAVRAEGLTREEFSRAWRSRAGQVRQPGTPGGLGGPATPGVPGVRGRRGCRGSPSSRTMPGVTPTCRTIRARGRPVRERPGGCTTR
jgi:hypothetical protein